MITGNDVVDLLLPENLASASNTRYRNRVLSPFEQEIHKNSPNPDLLFWHLWSAKESAFKVISKLNPQTLFSHRRFEVHPDWQTSQNTTLNGVVKYKNETVSVRWDKHSGFLHCIANLQTTTRQYDLWTDVRKLNDFADPGVFDFNPEESGSIHSEESYKVRLLAKSLYHRLTKKNPRIIRLKSADCIRLGPPEIYLEQIPDRHSDLSLSHDGEYLAVSLAISRQHPQNKNLFKPAIP